MRQPLTGQESDESVTPPAFAAMPSEPEAIGTDHRFQMLVDCVRDSALFMLDPQGTVSSWNPGAEWLFGHPAVDIIGEPVSILHVPDDAESVSGVSLLEHAANSGNVRSEGWRRRLDGSRFWAEIVVTALHHDDGSLAGFGKVTRDLTDRRRIEEALVAAKEQAEAASVAKSQFLATMSHEIRTPINAVLGYTQLLELGLSGPVTDEQRQKLQRVEASARHLLGLVNELLDLAKIESDQLHVDCVRGAAKEASNEALSLVFPEANARRISLSSSCAGDVDADFLGDPRRVEQIVTNLLSNAIKFTAPGGRIELACGVSEHAPSNIRCHESVTQWCWIRVADSGVGIRDDNFEAIFAPFTQASSATAMNPARRTSYSREHGGTGLGLTISRRLARLMRGDITVESSFGVGSSFTLWLPAPVAVTPSVDLGSYVGETDRRTGSRDARGLALVGRTVRERSSTILATHVKALRAHLGLPHPHRMADVDLEDHLDTLLTELALALTSVESAAGQPSRQLRDGNAIQRVLGQRHGAQRASLGWTEDQLRREVRVLRQEIDDEVRMQLSVSADADVDAALGVVARLLAYVERSALDGWRKRMNPAANVSLT